MSSKSILILFIIASYLSSCKQRAGSNLDETNKADLSQNYLGNQVRDSYKVLSKRHNTNQFLFTKLQNSPSAQLKSTNLNVLNYNVGLLFVANGFIEVPFYKARSKAFAANFDDFLNRREISQMKNPSYSPDVMFFQELWYDVDRTTLINWAGKNGYIVALNNKFGTKNGTNAQVPESHGLNLAVKQEILKKDTGVSNCYFEKMGLEEIAFTTKRGLLSCEITLKNGDTISLNATHLTFGFGDKQNKSRETKLDLIAQRLANKKTDFVLLGGDFNLSPEFSGAKLNEQEGWANNRAGYVRFVEATSQVNLIDSYIVNGFENKDSYGYTQDRDRNVLTKESASTAPEPEQRLDYIWAGSSKGGALIKSHQLVFTWNAVDSNSASMKHPFSDHFGVYSELTLFRAK